ncbi:Hypothetical protein A7982_03562 [Minicystis rosea]|nr:Hypothetical protein A7982_03562 [Minicystis rosea]
MKRWIPSFAGILLGGALCGCTEPIHRSLSEGIPVPVPAAPRKAHVASIEVLDERPSGELSSISPGLIYLVPLVIFNVWASEGDVRPEAELYTPDLRGEMRARIEDAIKEGHLFGGKGAGPGLRVQVKVKHLYGVTHASKFSLLIPGFSSTTERTFAPYGYAAAEVRLSEASGRVIGTRQITGSYIAAATDLKNDPKARRTINLLTLAAVYAASDLSANIVRAIEPMVADVPAEEHLDLDALKTFVLARAAPEGPFLELAAIDYESGKVVADKVVPRWMEPYSPIDEWVVDPYLGSNSRLTPEKYRGLIEHLAKRYDVRFVKDVRVAHFFGVKAPPPGP